MTTFPCEHEPDALLDVAQVKRISSLSRSTIERNIKLGRFPASVQVTLGRVAWRQSDIKAWLADPFGWGEAKRF